MNRTIVAVLSCTLLCSPLTAGDNDIVKAIRRDDISSLIFILQNVGPEKASESGPDGVTPLHVAAAMNKPDMIGVLISFGADVDATTDNGFTPLHWAASRDAMESSRALIIGGANIDAATPTGITPLHWAASKNATNVVAYLLSHDSDIDAATASGMRPVHWAARKKAEESELLLADVEISRELEKQDPAAASFIPDATDTNELDDSLAMHVPIPIMTPTIHKGHSFTIQLGSGQELRFIWIEQLKLWFGKCEVTNGQYRRYKHSHTSMFVESLTLDDDEQPAVFVSWNDAKQYCNWLNKNYSGTIPSGWFFRLPLSQEWIFAARCGTERTYAWGNEWPPKYGNYSDASGKDVFSDWKGIENYNDGFPATCRVTDSGTNEWGLCGMGGNVWEWCEDWYGKERKYKVRHGGGWDFDANKSLTIDYRGFDKPNMKYDTIGFRIVISKKPDQK